MVFLVLSSYKASMISGLLLMALNWLVALLGAVGERVVFLLWLLLFLVTTVLEVGSFLGHLLHGGALLLQCVVTAHVVRVNCLLVRRLISTCIVTLGVFHHAVDEESTVYSLCVGHSFSPLAVALDFMVLALWDGILVKVVKSPDLVGHFEILHIENFASGEHVGAFDRALTDLLVDDGLVDLVIDRVGHGSLLLELVTFLLVLLTPDSSFVCSGEVDIIITDNLRASLLEHG
jgi:hypothetical protein